MRPACGVTGERVLSAYTAEPTATGTGSNPMTATITLDVCTPDGNTWLAQLTGLDPKFTFHREFVQASSKNVSRSGMTGTKTYYFLTDGIYQSREPRRSLRHTDGRDGQGNRFYSVSGDQVTTIDLDAAVAEFTAGGAQ